MAAEKRPPRPGEGHPPHVPTEATRKQVAAMTAYGVPQDDIAACIGISDVTLRKHYTDIIAVAMAEANSKIAQHLFKIALGDSKSAVTAAIFWLKTRGGVAWKEKIEHEHSGNITMRVDTGIERDGD
jgi:hypothetical protein